MRRILLLITDLQIGGTPTVVRELALRLSAPGAVEVQVACLSTMGPVGEILRARGIAVTALNAKGPTDLFAITRLAKLIRREKFDTVFSFLIHANVAAAVVWPLFPRTRFVQSIQTTQPEPAWHWTAQRIVHRVADKIVVPSESVAEAAIERSHIAAAKIAIISNAIDLLDFVFEPRVGIANPARIGFIGRLDPIKRIDDLIDAVRMLGPSVTLDIYGEGRERNRLQALASGLPVTFHGAIDSPQAALRAMDLLVLPSDAEGFGLVLIEAMAAGIPVIGTDVPGIRNVVENKVTGLLVQARSPGEIAGAIRKVMEDEVLRAQLVQSARRSVEQRFTWDAVLSKYRALLSSKGANSSPASGMPGEGWGGGSGGAIESRANTEDNPLPGPPPEYPGRE